MPTNYAFQLNGNSPISNNRIKLKISNNSSSVSSHLIINTNFKIINLTTDTLISTSYSVNAVSVEDDETTFQISFTENNFLASTPISIQFYIDSSNYSNILNIFLLQLSSITNNSVAIIVPNRMGSNIRSSNLIIKNLSNNSTLRFSSTYPLSNNQYSISSSPSATPTSCTIIFANNFLEGTTNRVSIQLKHLAPNSKTIAISTLVYINFPSPYDSKIQILKPYLIKYVSRMYFIKITLNNQYDNTLPTNYKNIVYKAIKQ